MPDGEDTSAANPWRPETSHVLFGIPVLISLGLIISSIPWGPIEEAKIGPFSHWFAGLATFSAVYLALSDSRVAEIKHAEKEEKGVLAKADLINISCKPLIAHSAPPVDNRKNLPPVPFSRTEIVIENFHSEALRPAQLVLALTPNCVSFFDDQDPEANDLGQIVTGNQKGASLAKNIVAIPARDSQSYVLAGWIGADIADAATMRLLATIDDQPVEIFPGTNSPKLVK